MKKDNHKAWNIGAGVTPGSIAILALMSGAPAHGADTPAPEPAEAVSRRLSPDQYRLSIADIFGPDIEVGGRFEPDIRTGAAGGLPNGLLAVGSSNVSVTAAGLEMYDNIARTIAAQVVDKGHREILVPCKPVDESTADDVCATQFIAKVGLLLYRRPLTPREVGLQVQAANHAANDLKSFYSGLATSLAGMMTSPQFLFREEKIEADPTRPGSFRLDAYSIASRLSFLFWDSGPDAELFRAAEKGELRTQLGRNKQVDRLLASPRLEGGVRAFFNDMLGFDRFATLNKDAMIFPKFSSYAMSDAQEQTLRTIVDHVVVQRGDYRDLFTTRKTFLTPLLGSVYSVRLVTNMPNGSPSPWIPYEFPPGDPRAGILTHASFLSLHSHPGRTSPTLRGRAIREILMCQKVPEPPGNVDFTLVNQTDNQVHKTARERLSAHATEAMCAGCHKLTDPVGLALENFDSGSDYRTAENGAAIDVSGTLDGTRFTTASELGKALHDSKQVPACLVRNLYSYAAGRTPTRTEENWLSYLEADFAKEGFRIPDLLRRIVSSEAFYQVTAPKRETTAASNQRTN